MIKETALLLIIPAAALLVTSSLPDRWANARVRTLRQIVTWMAGVQFALAALFLAAFASGWLPTFDVVLFRLASGLPITLSIFYDGVSGLMWTLVSFVGWVICRYSIRYLDGEATQGRYYRWTAFTLGSVSLMVISGNLLMFVTSWILTSLGLHQLLLHYGDRPAAQRAAWTKFVISRIGDAALIGALVTVYQLFGTLEFAELFTAARGLTNNLPELNAVGFLLVAGAATKSAQFPFHTWLPQTLETPTPVSALMHAGIVNAGGYLIIRTSPLVALTPWALTTLALIGGFTACFAAIVMLTQTSIKKSLAYSTIAQMGFMLLQCGLGAYSAAMLHILAHSLYKAHAFLASGSVIAERAAMEQKTSSRSNVSVLKLAGVGIVMVATLGMSLKMFGIDLATKSGGLLLGGVLCLALTHWIGQVLRHGNPALALRAVAVACGLCILYAFTYCLVDWTVAANLPAAGPELLWLVSTLIAIGFTGLLTFQFLVTSNPSADTLVKWHVHAANGFYLESLLRRVLRPLATNGN